MTFSQIYLSASQLDSVDKIINLALAEDTAEGDISTDVLNIETNEAIATITSKADGIISGIAIANIVVCKVAGSPEDVEFIPFVSDGDKVKKGQTIAHIKGNVETLLKAERTMLNFMQRMSGIATETAEYVKATKGTKTTILDTRKTAPGLRAIDKMAIAHGGGKNHRMGLYDMVMLKDNHIKAMGSITEAVKRAHLATPISVKIEVETTNLTEVKEALEAKADIIMLDNMSNEDMQKAVKLIAGKAKTEASGNMTLERIAEVAALGVDYISVGALTHSVKALDISMNFDK